MLKNKLVLSALAVLMLGWNMVAVASMHAIDFSCADHEQKKKAPETEKPAK